MNMKRVNLFRQLKVLVARYARLILNDKASLAATLLQAPVMALVVKMVGVKDCFTSVKVTTASQTILFVVAIMAAFMGILGSYREICKEKDIIARESSVGVSILATLLSKVIVLLVISLIQGIVLTAGLFLTVEFEKEQSGLLFSMPVEVFITVMLILVASSSMGLLISAALETSEAAILPVLFVLIGQVVFCGVVFKMEGVGAIIGNFIVNKWGMSALGATCRLNNRMKWLQLDQTMYDSTVENLLHSWEMLAVIGIVCIVVAYILMRMRFGKKN